MIIAPAPKISGNFQHYLESTLRDRGPVIITNDDDVPVAALIKLTGAHEVARLIQAGQTVAHDPTTSPEKVENTAHFGPSEEEVLNDTKLFSFYTSQIRPRLVKFGIIYTTYTPDIRVGLPGRKKSSVLALIRKRRNTLKLFVRVGNKAINYPDFAYDSGNPDMGTYDLRPAERVPTDLDKWLETAKQFTDQM